MKQQSSSYHNALIASLQQPAEAAAYLQAIKEEYPAGLDKALRNVQEALELTAPTPIPADEVTP